MRSRELANIFHELPSKNETSDTAVYSVYMTQFISIAHYIGNDKNYGTIS